MHASHMQRNNTSMQSPPSSHTTSPSSQNIIPVESPPRRIITRSMNNIHRPIHKLNLNSTVSSVSPEPCTVKEALSDPNWRHAMSEEFNALIKNGTWTLVSRTGQENIVGCKWVFRTKRLSNGTIDRYKARLVAKGFHQRPGVDYTETFSPVIKPTTIRLVLSLAVSRGWPLRQIDVNNAFLQGHLYDDVYMLQPPGFVDPTKPTHICRLHKVLYGLKQAPRAWYQELKNFLLQLGFINSKADTSLFVYHHANHIIYILVYVDDIVITGSSTAFVEDLIVNLGRRFSLKDLGALSFFLGIEVISHPHGILLSQRRYILDLLSRTKMTSCNGVTTPLASTSKLSINSGKPLADPEEYRSVVGSLQYLALTRPDLSYAINKLSQFLHRPTTDHWEAVKRVLRYLRHTTDHGLLLRRSSALSLHAYSDADWAGNPDDYTSTGAFVIFLGPNAISWSSRKQRTVAWSSTEAEYRSVATTAAELRWILSLLTELHVVIPTQPAIYCDNVGATHLCANPVFHSRMKHLALDYHFIREHVQNGIFRVSHVRSEDQLADSLTKPLPRRRFHDLHLKIGVLPRPSNLRGHIGDKS
ncbi:unnamed protein product [Cuscuta epithymum]|uniref:Reverse transcriptase Ty1/copia-type domain-containing protein n=1 Tax=Cuscuta epithymum TaxID=186058 RepID=A0AAV0ENN5_9ASTE|nr:unnamed protein product [Cuscuta epithymum]